MTVTCFEPSISGEGLLGSFGLVPVLLKHVCAFDVQFTGFILTTCNPMFLIYAVSQKTRHQTPAHVWCNIIYYQQKQYNVYRTLFWLLAKLNSLTVKFTNSICKAPYVELRKRWNNSRLDLVNLPKSQYYQEPTLLMPDSYATRLLVNKEWRHRNKTTFCTAMMYSQSLMACRNLATCTSVIFGVK